MKKEFIIDLKGVRLAKTVHQKLAKVLPFPKDYGNNFDALYDFLTEYGPKMKIVFKHAKSVGPTLKRVCDDAVENTPGLEITFE